jgi:hypothetical protein
MVHSMPVKVVMSSRYSYVCFVCGRLRTLSVPRLHVPSNRMVTEGNAVAQLVEALCYKPEGRGFDS